MKPPVFLTGATGFLGMEVLARLLEAGDREVVALVRARDDAARPASASTACSRSCGAIRRRTATASAPCAGDLTQPGLGIANAERTSARRGRRRGPALRRLDLVRPAARRGARDQRRGHARGDRLRARGKALGRLERFVHVSTAYCRGELRGHVPRAPARRRPGRSATPTSRPSWRPSRSSATAADLQPAIARPSIVMGESDTGWTPGVQRPLLAAAGVLARAVRRGPGAARRRAWTSCRSTTSPTRSCTCSTCPSQGVVQPRRRARRGDRRRARSTLACDRFDRPRPEVVARRAARTTTSTARSTCRTSTWRSCSTTPAPAPRCRAWIARRGCPTTSAR